MLTVKCAGRLAAGQSTSSLLLPAELSIRYAYTSFCVYTIRVHALLQSCCHNYTWVVKEMADNRWVKPLLIFFLPFLTQRLELIREAK